MPRRGRGRGGRRRGGSVGRGQGRGQGGAVRRTESTNEQEEVKQELNIDTDPGAYFTGTATTEQHLEGQKANRTRYAATLASLIESKIEVTQNACIRALAMAWAREDHELASAFLTFKSHFGLVEVLKAVSMLDAGRQIRAEEKCLMRLQLLESKVNSNKLEKLNMNIKNLNKIKPPIGSASGAVCKHVARWVRNFTAEELEFFSIHFPKDPWKKLADICHLHPEKDFPKAPWFLPFCFGTGLPPADSIVPHCLNLTEKNVNAFVSVHNIPFSFLKGFKQRLSPYSKSRIARYEPKLDTVIWWFEDLACPEAEAVISERLASGDPVNLPNGKLLERLLTISIMHNAANLSMAERKKAKTGIDFFSRLKDVADQRIKSISLSLESPVVVIGDASGSMEVAIRTSTIIAGLLTAICSAQLVFFNTETRVPPFMPATVKAILKLALITAAKGGTAPAASLYPFYQNKEIVKTFIIVTDENENKLKEGYRFSELYKKYHDEVYPAVLIFVSFLEGQHAQGQMVNELNNIGFYPKQIRLESSRPDLSKLDDLFAQLSASTTTSFHDELLRKEEFIKENGVETLFQLLKKEV